MKGADEYNPDPYKFIGYLYARVNMDTYWEQAGDLFDSIAIDILSNQQLINLAEDPYYNPLKDKKVIGEIKNGNLNFNHISIIKKTVIAPICTLSYWTM